MNIQSQVERATRDFVTEAMEIFERRVKLLMALARLEVMREKLMKKRRRDEDRDAKRKEAARKAARTRRRNELAVLL